MYDEQQQEQQDESQHNAEQSGQGDGAKQADGEKAGSDTTE